MTRLTQVKLGLGVAALLAFAWGVRTEDERLTWVAIALLGAAFLLRFVKQEPRG